MTELLQKFRTVEHYIASLCDETIQGINFNPENHTWTLISLIDECKVFKDIEGLIIYLKYKEIK